MSIEVHQRNTVQSLSALRKIAPGIRWLPVVQGWTADSYLAHLKMYRASGFALETEPLVGVGSLATRQSSETIREVLYTLQGEGLRIHAFGLSFAGLRRVHHLIESTDSMVWSFVARRRNLKFDGCRARHKRCNNCLEYARAWRASLMSQLAHRILET